MIGTTVSNYRILSKLGQGGMGVVYKATDLTLERSVAIKVLSHEFAQDPVLVERFRTEAKAQATLNHTNVASLYSFLEIKGMCLIVLEFVDGETFDHMISTRGPLPVEQVIPLFKQTLLGIGFAHRMGIIHRDIKPGNLMLNRDGIVKVMDFGLAKVITGTRHTRAGSQLGTAGYMSPEQIRGLTVDVRSDIYALGVTLYELVAGRLPFEAATEFEMLTQHMNVPPPPPSRFHPVSHRVEQAILRALHKDPSARFQCVEEFGSALERSSVIPLPGRSVPQPVIAVAGGRAVKMKRLSPAAGAPSPSPRPALAALPANAAPKSSIFPPPPAAAIKPERALAAVLGVLALCLVMTLAALKDSWPVLLGTLIFLIFLPMLVALLRRKRNGRLIIRTNVCLGLTVYGWILAMQHALSDEE